MTDVLSILVAYLYCDNEKPLAKLILVRGVLSDTEIDAATVDQLV